MLRYFIAIVFVSVVAGVEIGVLPNEQHNLGGVFHIVDTNTIAIDDFEYDGGGPGAWFYYYEPGVVVDSSGGGHKIPLPPEFGQSDGKLKSMYYNGVDITVTLPDGVDACDIGTFTVWCEPFQAIFTRIEIPTSIFENEGVGECALIGSATIAPPVVPEVEFDNCFPFDESLQLSWRVHTNESLVRFRLCGCQSTTNSTNQYMGFGLSGSDSATLMVGADPTIAWVDPLDGPQAVDYYLSAYTQCRSGEGACPDTLDISGNCTNDVYNVEGSVEDGIQCVSFTRNFSTSDSTCDTIIDPINSNQYIVWAIGGLGETAFRHFKRATSSESPIHLGRSPQDQCVNVSLACQSCSPFTNNMIIAREDTAFDVVIGPSGNERGYMGITGRAGWGISFYVNGTIIPELTVERGRTYTFLIHGGDNPDDISNYHPLYITDSIGGGRLRNTPEQIAEETVYAGFDGDGQVTAVGDLCQLKETSASESTRESCSSLQEYISTFSIPDTCNTGEPGVLIWSPNDTTPDLVYYQCATHLNLGWKIHVLDKNESAPNNTNTDNFNSTDGFANCIPFTEDLQLSWTVNYEQSNIRFKLCGCHSTQLDVNQYMGFGLSGSSIGIQMQGADPTLVWVDGLTGPQAVDYHLSDYQKCSDGVGACPDILDSSGSCTNDAYDVEGSITDGVQCVSFTRNLTTADSTCDKDIDPNNEQQYVVWAMGMVQDTALYHTHRIKSNESPIHLGRSPQDQCVNVSLACQSCSPFTNNRIIARNDTTFDVVIGPSGNERGYMGITGRTDGNISFYVNGTIIPELTVERGRTYTFLIHGGDNPDDISNYHPLYITDSIGGGRLRNTPEQMDEETVYAGFDGDGQVTAVGDLCQLKETSASESTRESCSSLQEYIATFSIPDTCNTGEPGVLIWSPDDTTPDLVYYQSATYVNLGWKIHVLDNNESADTDTSNSNSSTSNDGFANCISFAEDLQLSWTVNYEQSNIRFKLCGCHSAKPHVNQYMGFGLSGSPIGIQMQGADPTLVWVDGLTGPQAVDYHLSAYQKCSNGVGACPDILDSSGSCTNDAYDVEGSITDGVHCVSFTRNLTTADSTCDKNIDPNNEQQYVVWAMGMVQDTALYHTNRITNTKSPIHFGREPLNQCINADIVCNLCEPFTSHTLIARKDTTFNVTVGPSGGQRGYTGITGHQGNNVSFYINGILIPELVIVRGKTYTFLIHSGDERSELYNPFYITDSISGGRLLNETVYTGLDDTGAVGEQCQLLETAFSTYLRESCSDLDMYINSLEYSESCSIGTPGVLIWTPDNDTPDLVYYQSPTQQNMGWKITIEDSTDEGNSAVTLTCSLLLLMIATISTLILS